MKPGARGHVIFVTGIPSSGKSSVAAKIKRRTSSFRLITGDEIIRQVPLGQRVAQAEHLFALTLETIERRLESANLIFDGAWTERQVVEAQDRFGEMGLYVVLRIDESERGRRERLRKDRRLAYWDPSWDDMPGPDEIYDLVIDSKVTKPSECANIVLNQTKQHWDDLLL